MRVEGRRKRLRLEATAGTGDRIERRAHRHEQGARGVALGVVQRRESAAVVEHRVEPGIRRARASAACVPDGAAPRTAARTPSAHAAHVARHVTADRSRHRRMRAVIAGLKSNSALLKSYGGYSGQSRRMPATAG